MRISRDVPDNQGLHVGKIEVCHEDAIFEVDIFPNNLLKTFVIVAGHRCVLILGIQRNNNDLLRLLIVDHFVLKRSINLNRRRTDIFDSGVDLNQREVHLTGGIVVSNEDFIFVF